APAARAARPLLHRRTRAPRRRARSAPAMRDLLRRRAGGRVHPPLRNARTRMTPAPARRKRPPEAMEPDSVAILLGAGLVVRSRDTHYRFRQDSDFHNLTGFDHPHAAAVLRTDGGPPFTLFVEPRDPEAETWT